MTAGTVPIGAADALAAAVAGRVADKCGPRPLTVLGAVAQIGGAAAVVLGNAAASGRTPVFFAASALLGLADGSLMVLGTYLLLRCFPRAHVEFAFSAKVGVHVAATSLGYCATTLLVEPDGVRSSSAQLLAEAATVLVALVLGTAGLLVAVPIADPSADAPAPEGEGRTDGRLGAPLLGGERREDEPAARGSVQERASG